MVLTGGSSLLPGMRGLASEVLGIPVRLARPENLIGLADQLGSPAYSTSVGLLYWAILMSDMAPSNNTPRRSRKGGTSIDWEALKTWIRRLLP
jgi:cell division protein FtsA